MIYSINFLDMTDKLNPIAVAKYLSETGWNHYTSKRNDIKIFQYIDGDIFEQVTIPIDKALRDYNIAMYSAVEKIALIEKKSVEQIMLYLLNPNTDILKIRLDKRDIEMGNILFDDAIKLFDNAKKLMAATALDIINPKKIHFGRIDESVQKFLTQCRFGQTEIGSYVASVVCPFAELSEEEGYKQLSIFSDEEQCANSLTRKVTNKIMSNVSFIKQRIDEGDINSLINTQGETLISSNFFEALNGLNLETENTIVEFTAEWSPTVKLNRSDVKNIRISSDYYQPISTVIDKIKETTNKTTEIIGRIKGLDAPPLVDKREYGMVTVVYISDDDKAKKIRVKLNKGDYDNAILAHQQGKVVKVMGELNDKPKAVMENVIFSIIE